MVQPEARGLWVRGRPAADVVDVSHSPTGNPHQRWYDAYIDALHRANELAIHNTKLHQQVATLRQALSTVLEETEGGNFLGSHTRDEVQQLLNLNKEPMIET